MEAGGLILIAVMVSVVLVLVTGLVMMARGGEANKKYSTKLMVLRVGLQALALAVVGVLFLVAGK